MNQQTREPNGPALAMAYVPMQRLDTVFSPQDALASGTLFPALFKPFLAYGKGGAPYDG